MKENIMTFINKTEGYKTAIKNFHWSSKNMSEHKLFDEIASAVADIQDEVSEMAQGLYGQISKNELKPISYEIKDEKTFLTDLQNTAKEFYSSIKESDDYIGIRSEIEAFIGEIDKDKYLMDLCLKEKNLNEHRKQIHMNEEEFKSYIAECVKCVLKQIII